MINHAINWCRGSMDIFEEKRPRDISDPQAKVYSDFL